MCRSIVVTGIETSLNRPIMEPTKNGPYTHDTDLVILWTHNIITMVYSMDDRLGPK